MNNKTGESIKNPEYCTIRRVENGWILESGNREMYHMCPHVFVFTRTFELATFIQMNFSLPESEA